MMPKLISFLDLLIKKGKHYRIEQASSPFILIALIDTISRCVVFVSKNRKKDAGSDDWYGKRHGMHGLVKEARVNL